MVSDVVHLDTTISQRIKHGEEEKDDEDTISVSTASTDNCDGAVVLQDAEDKAPCFQNIEVTNSSDVHFGNKTYYQGPVTIKQILYTNRDGENKLPQTNGIHHEQPHLAINEKVNDSLNCESFNDGYTTDGVHHINGHAKLPNGINHDHFETIRGSGEKKLSKNQWLLVGGAIFVVILLIITAVTLALSLKGSSTPVSEILVDEEGPNPEYQESLPPGLRMISRAEWKAKPNKGEYTLLKKPLPFVIIHHTATARCFNRTTCTEQAVSIQNYHMGPFGWDDIGYNFMIGGDGYVYEARGWDYMGAHAKGYNNVSIGIAFIGTFTQFLPKPYQLEQAHLLIEEGVKKGCIRKDYKLVGMNQVSSFESPGKLLIKEIKTWPHFFDFNAAAPKSESQVLLSSGSRIISRAAWGAKPHIGEYTVLKTPVPYVIIHHTETDSCFDFDACKLEAIYIQDFHMRSCEWDDIGYNFMIGGDGYVYEARGWDNMGAHAKGYNNISIGIAFIGTFQTVLPEPSQLEQAHILIEEGIKNGHISKDYRLVGMNQVTSFSSPGKLLIKEIKTWPHFFDFKTQEQQEETQTSPSPNYRMISRAEWGAKQHKGEYVLLKTPIPYVIIHHTGTERCFDQDTCKIQATSIQDVHMESLKWDDIGYNFMIGGDGYVYEGRGWNYMGAHAKGYNNVSFGIAFIGTFTKLLPEPSQLEQAHILIEEGVKKGYISKDYKLIGLNQVSTFESPGKLLIQEIKTWPHFFDFNTERPKRESQVLLPSSTRMISRAQWGAKQHKGEYVILKTPIPYVIIHHTRTERCFDQDTCKIQATSIQDFHMESLKWDDIGYNFMIGGDSYVYEGRGWDYVGSHAKGYNNVSIGIAFIGTFTELLPEFSQLQQAHLLIEEGVNKGYISKDYKLIGMNQISTFESPGKLLTQEIKTWPHFFDFNTERPKRESQVLLPSSTRMISRAQWGAKQHKGEYVLLKTPIPYVIIHHTRTERCFDQDTCKIQATSIQDFHMESLKWDDIGYNFMIGGDSYVYEGRGWDYVGSHAKGYNNVSIGIAFIGTFTELLPEFSQLQQAHLLIEEGVNKGYISKDYKLIGMNQISTFESPGKLLTQEIKTWPHFFDFKTEKA